MPPGSSEKSALVRLVARLSRVINSHFVFKPKYIPRIDPVCPNRTSNNARHLVISSLILGDHITSCRSQNNLTILTVIEQEGANVHGKSIWCN
jgi:hypothetical protein